MRPVSQFLNPIYNLGKGSYSLLFPILGTTIVAVLLELYVEFFAINPEAASLPAIVLFVSLTIYFSFRTGIRGGVLTVIVTVIYYLYIVSTRNYEGQQLVTALETIGVLGLLYLVIALVIGWLKQTIDRLIVREANEKKRLQAIIEQLPVGIVIVDDKGNVVQTNSQVGKIIQADVDKGFRIGKDKSNVRTITNKSVKSSDSPVLQALHTGKQISGRQFLFDRRDGKIGYLLVNASPIHDSDGKVFAAVSILSDITHQKEIEKRKDDFINIASHELKTPITSLRLYLDILEKNIKKQKVNGLMPTLKSIRKQTSNLHDLVNELLDVSRMQTGKFVFNKEEFRLDDLIRETIRDLEKSIDGQKVEFKKKVRIIVNADKFRISQVLINLINNAVKYSSGNGRVIVRMKKSNGKVTVSVQDFGIGIEKEQQSKIFEKLYQVADSKSDTYPGFGMGLYISKQIINKHRGKIWVESEKDKGSTFYFCLPL